MKNGGKLSVYFRLAVLLPGFSLVSCDTLTKEFCGELTATRRQYVETLNKAYGKWMHVAQAPCYSNYLQIHCRAPAPTTTLDSIDRTSQQFDWQEVLVYDQHNKLIRGDTGSM